MRVLIGSESSRAITMIKSCRPQTRIDSKRTTTTSEKRTRNNRQNVEFCACRFDIDRSNDCFDMRVRINTCATASASF